MLNIHKAGKLGLAVQDVKVNPKVAVIGELVGVKLNISSTLRNNINGKVNAFYEDCTVTTRELKVGISSYVLLSLELDTIRLPSGVYSIQALIEANCSQQQIYNLGA